MERRTISCTTIEYNSVSQSFYADQEHVAETWQFTIDPDELDVDEIVIREDGVTLTGDFEVVYNDNYELLELR